MPIRPSAFRWLNRPESDFTTTNSVLNTLKALEAIAQHLAGVYQAVDLIWLSGSFPLPNWLRSEFQCRFPDQAATFLPGRGDPRRAGTK